MIVRVELKGPDNSLRLRQLKVLGKADGSPIVAGKHERPLAVQQRNCEVETLRVFRLLTSQVRCSRHLSHRSLYVSEAPMFCAANNIVIIPLIK